MKCTLQKRQIAIISCTVVLICVQFLWMNLIQDGYTHVARLIYLAENIKNLGIYEAINSKIYFGMIDGAGYGFPTFYGDKLVYPFALVLSLIGINKDNAENLYKAYSLGCYAIQFIVQFLCTHKMLKKTKGHTLRKEKILSIQLVDSYVWVVTPLNLSNIYYKTVQRTLASAFIPIAIYSLYSLVESCLSDDKVLNIWKYVLMLQISIWLILQQHNITFLFVVLILLIEVVYLLYQKIKLKEPKTNHWQKLIKYFGIQIAICGLQSLSFLIPMLNALKSGIYVISNQRYNLQQSINTSFKGLFFPDWTLSTLEYVISGNSQNDVYMSTGYYGFYYIIFIVFGLYLIHKGLKSLGIVNIAYVIVSYCLVYQKLNINILQFIQYRFRLNTILDVAMVTLMVINLVKVSDIHLKFYVNSIIFVGLVQQVIQITLTQSAMSIDYDAQIQVGNGGEYLVYNEMYDTSSNEDNTIQYNTQKQINDILRYRKSFETFANEQVQYNGNTFNQVISLNESKYTSETGNEVTKIQLPYIYYEGYKVYVNDRLVNEDNIKPDSLGLIEIQASQELLSDQKVGQDTVKIAVIYDDSTVYKVLNTIQFVAILVQIASYTIIIAKQSSEKKRGYFFEKGKRHI